MPISTAPKISSRRDRVPTIKGSVAKRFCNRPFSLHGIAGVFFEHIRRWGYVLFISRLCKGHGSEILERMHDDEEYYVQMAQAWLIAELAIHESQTVYGWLRQSSLKYNICGKAIQKISDSFRIPEEWKAAFKKLRPELRVRR